MNDTPTPNSERKKKDPYHTAAFSAFKFFLRDYVNRGVVTLEDEKHLSQSPLKIDFMIIKKAPDVVIKRGWGKIMRGHNVVEYKSPVAPATSLHVFDKVVNGYVGVYAEQNKIRLTDMSATIICYKKPKTLFETLKRDFYYEILHEGDGIYYIKLKGVPIEKSLAVQVVVSSELSDDDLELKAIMRKLEAEIAKKVANRYLTKDKKVPPELNQWVNFMYLKEFDTLTEELEMNEKRQIRKMMKYFDEKGFLTEFKNETMQEGMQRGMQKVFALLEKGYSLTEAKEKLQLV